MNFFIVDDDSAVRYILRQIIEDEDLGTVIGEAEDGEDLEGEILNLKQIDLLLIDLLMPGRDGIETVQHIKSSFSGKIIMISQVETKDLIVEAYTHGIEYYITKPINKTEVLTLVRKVAERIYLENSIHTIQTALSGVMKIDSIKGKKSDESFKGKLLQAGEYLLSELGMAGEAGSKDLLSILQYLADCEQPSSVEQQFPSLKEVFSFITVQKLGSSALEKEVEREIKASQQRIRRAINQSLTHFASLGLTDYAHPKFEQYSSIFFDFNVVRQRMNELKKDTDSQMTSTRVNTKKFIQAFFFDAKRLVER